MYRLKQLILLAGDLAMLFVGFYLALALRYGSWPHEREIGPLIAPLEQLFFVAVIMLFIIGLYDIARTRNSWSFFQKILITAPLWGLIGIIYFYINPLTRVTPKTILLLVTAIGFGLIGLWRYVYNRFLARVIGQTTVVFAGITPESVEAAERITKQPERGFRIIGFIDDHKNTNQLSSALAHFDTSLTLQDVLNKNNNRHPGVIVLAPTMAGNRELSQELYQTLFRQTSIITLADFYETVFNRVPPFTFSESWFVAHLKEQDKKIYDRFRVLIDYTAALIMALFWLITFPFIALLIKATTPGPIFFKQTRVGRNGKEFTIYKYRTMQALTKEGSAEIGGPQFAAEGDARITPAGKFLRLTRLDEIPQFINILKGDMAIVGPRPERPEFVAELTKQMPFYSLRLLIKPGLTGWAQLHKSYYGTIDENLKKLEYDLYYLKNRGAVLDLVILLRTIAIVAKMAGR